MRTPQDNLPLETEERSARIRVDVPLLPVPDLERHVETLTDLDEIWSYINPQMLFGRHLGFKGRFTEALEAGDVKAVELQKNVEKVKAEARQKMTVQAVWQFFEAEPDGNKLHIFEPGEAVPVETFVFPRQRKADGMALSDLVLPPQRDARGRAVTRDHVALFVTTAGAGIRELAEEAKLAGRVPALVRADGARA